MRKYAIQEDAVKPEWCVLSLYWNTPNVFQMLLESETNIKCVCKINTHMYIQNLTLQT